MVKLMAVSHRRFNNSLVIVRLFSPTILHLVLPKQTDEETLLYI